MANLVAEGVRQVAGAEPVVRTVPELIPAAVIESRADMKAGRDLQKDIPLVTADDFREAGAIAFGTPTRFGNVSSNQESGIRSSGIRHSVLGTEYIVPSTQESPALMTPDS